MMANKSNADIRGLVATMLMMPVDQVQGDTSLRSLDNSLGGAKLMLGLKRLGIKTNFQKVPPTFGDLGAVLEGNTGDSGLAREAPASTPAAVAGKTNPVNAPVTLAAVRSADSGALSLGHDIQEISAFPVVSDYWEHEFYRGSFSSRELAYAVTQSEPRHNLAGFWSAKEALKKCDPEFIHTDLASLSVTHDAEGKPYFEHLQGTLGTRLPHALSISHSGSYASAVVIAMSRGE